MKLRITGNSVRLRLQRNEVEALAESGRVEERLCLGAGPAAGLRFAVAAVDTADLGLEYAPGDLIVHVPKSWAQAWAGTDETGREALVETGGAEAVRVLVEKDFKCLVQRPEEDESDHYPNPNRHC